MSKIRYKLTLEVNDNDRTTFTTECECDSQEEMGRNIPTDIARALVATMASPPSSMAMAGAMEGDPWSLITGLAFAYSEWDGELDFDDCVSIIVDIDKLCATNEPDRNDRIKEWLGRHGIEIKSKPIDPQS